MKPTTNVQYLHFQSTFFSACAEPQYPVNSLHGRHKLYTQMRTDVWTVS